jgi:lysyl-tRNA synthetase class 2
MLKKSPFFIRQQVIQAARLYLQREGFEEVITPILKESLPLEPNLYAFQTKWETTSQDKVLYLQTSPEAYLKKMISQGLGNCFAVSPSFRNLENSGTKHSPEFLMLEWYRQNSNYQQIMEDTKDLILYIQNHLQTKGLIDPNSYINYQNVKIDFHTDWPILSLVDLFQKYANINIKDILGDQQLSLVANQKGYTVDNSSWSALFDQIFLNEIEPHLPSSPLFLTDFPSRISPLCKPKSDQAYLAERFELYIANIEVANGNTENTNTIEISNVFEQEKFNRQSTGLLAPKIDTQFLDSLEKMKNHSYAGIGLGIDRLAMIFADQNNINTLENL